MPFLFARRIFVKAYVCGSTEPRCLCLLMLCPEAVDECSLTMQGLCKGVKPQGTAETVVQPAQYLRKGGSRSGWRTWPALPHGHNAPWWLLTVR